MKWVLAALFVHTRGVWHRVLRRSDTTGLTVPCAGRCGAPGPHDAHLARGALAYLGGRS